jgi:hypothetical protein
MTSLSKTKWEKTRRPSAQNKELANKAEGLAVREFTMLHCAMRGSARRSPNRRPGFGGPRNAYSYYLYS